MRRLVRWVRRVKKTVRGYVFSDARVGRVCGKEEQPCPSGPDGGADGGRLVAAEVVQNGDGVWSQRRDQSLLDIGAESLAIDRPVDHPGCDDPVMAQRGDERHASPLSSD